MDDMPRLVGLNMFATSQDVIEVTCINTGSSTPIDFTGWTAGVRVYTGRDAKLPTTVFRRPTSYGAAPSTVGVSYPPDTTDVVDIAIQPNDLMPNDPDVDTIELWAWQGSWPGTTKVLIAMIRVSVYANVE